MNKKLRKLTPGQQRRCQLVRHFRTSLGLSQPELGAMLGVNQSTISNYETQGRQLEKPVELALLRLADEHGFPITLSDLRES